jgi:hypothetical protein
MSTRDPIDNLRYFAGRICTIHTRPSNWKLDQQQNLDYFMGLVESIDPMGVVLKNTINSNKTYVFLESIIAIAEESVHESTEDLKKAIEDYDSKKAEILKTNPNLATSKPAKAPTPPPPPPSPCSSGGCGSSSFMDINSITQIAGQAREKLKGQ